MAEPIAWIPYGAYWSTPFAGWQGAFADLHALRFAAHVARRAMTRRAIDPASIDAGILGMTVPQSGSFYGLPWLAGMIGAEHVAGPTVMQACATSARCVAIAARDVAAGGAAGGAGGDGPQRVLVITADRVSNGPILYHPAPRGPDGSGNAEDWVMANFTRDPYAGVAMATTAENCAARWSIDRAEQDDVVLMRRAQYDDALADDQAFHRRFMDLPFDVPDAAFAATAKVIDGDTGVQPANPDKLRALRPVMPGGTLTHGGQTHPADGNAGMVVTSRSAALDMAPGGPMIAVTGIGTARVEPAFMPSAPVPATARALAMAGVGIDGIDSVKSHNPFAINDIVFARETGRPIAEMNNYGCSLIWGHPQAPTGLRALIELIEELAMRGGGRGLFHGCAAGDSAMALVIEVR